MANNSHPFLCVTDYTKTSLFDTSEIAKEQYITQNNNKKNNKPHNFIK
jgi:hypothetical protein